MAATATGDKSFPLRYRPSSGGYSEGGATFKILGSVILFAPLLMANFPIMRC
jgi:hypothetical protein